MTSDTEAPLRGCRILLVEDDYLIAVDMASILEEHGADVLGPVGRVADALAMLAPEAIAPAMAVLDLDLNGTPSYPVADALIARGVPFLFTTGFSSEAVAAPYRGHPRLEKPIVERALLAALRQMALDKPPGEGKNSPR